MATKELNKSALWIMRGLALIGMGLSIYIVWIGYAGGQLAGCGQGGGCEEVIHTKWSSLFGQPVAAGGALVYAAILYTLLDSLSPAKWRRLITLTVLAAASGLWFIGLQLFIIKGFCIYCTTVHTCGILLMALTLWNAPVETPPLTPKEAKKRGEVLLATHRMRAVLLGLIGVAVLAGGQLLAGRAPVVATENLPAPKVNVIQMPSHQVSLAGGKVQVKVGEFPTLGSPNAPRNVVMLFDYTCPACRHVHPQLEEALKGHESASSIILIPMPLDAQCNAGIQQTAYQHMNACQFAKMGLAVWNNNPSAYAAFDHFMFEGQYPPSLEQARAMADRLVGKDVMASAMANAHYDELVQYGIQLFYSPLLQKKVLPSLITPEQVIEGMPEPTQLTTMF